MSTRTNPALRRVFGTPAASSGRPLTLPDVVVHTAGLFAVAVVGAVAGWLLVPAAGPSILVAFLVALALSVAISTRRASSPTLVVSFAVVEGFAVGGVSRLYESTYDGVVVQALVGAAAVFVSMLVAYRAGWIQATPRLRKVVMVGLLGVVAVSLLDLGLRLVTGTHLPVLNDPTPLGVAVSVGILVLAALQFVCDFDYIEDAIAVGVDSSEAWRAGFGLLVSFVWVYLELLRLLSKLQRR